MNAQLLLHIAHTDGFCLIHVSFRWHKKAFADLTEQKG